MIRGKKGKNIKNVDGVVRRKKVPNFGKVLNQRGFVSFVAILVMLLVLAGVGVFYFLTRGI